MRTVRERGENPRQSRYCEPGKVSQSTDPESKGSFIFRVREGRRDVFGILLSLEEIFLINNNNENNESRITKKNLAVDVYCFGHGRGYWHGFSWGWV